MSRWGLSSDVRLSNDIAIENFSLEAEGLGCRGQSLRSRSICKTKGLQSKTPAAVRYILGHHVVKIRKGARALGLAFPYWNWKTVQYVPLMICINPIIQPARGIFIIFTGSWSLSRSTIQEIARALWKRRYIVGTSSAICIVFDWVLEFKQNFPGQDAVILQ